jgi:protein-S-isoprenylcysteine O-methyltransferase Ste14
MALQEEFEKQGVWLFRYRGTLPLIVLLIGFAIYLWQEMTPPSFFLEGTPWEFYYELGCLAVGLIGLAIRIYTIGYAAKNTSGRNTEAQVADSLNTTGIYSVVRHPLYLGNYLMWLSPALLTGNLWFIIIFQLIYWIYYERIMFAEEQYLRRKFGDAYLRWAAQTPAFFPRFRGFKSSRLSFSWKKVLRQEKNGLVALFLIFALFNISGELIKKGACNFNYFFITAAAVTLFGYLVLKYLKRCTAVLSEDNR